MESLTDFVLLVKVILCVAIPTGASFDSHPLLQNRGIPPLKFYAGMLGPPQELLPDYTYTEVRTPFYHYYVYAPDFRTSLPEDSHAVPSSYDEFSSYKKTLRIPEDKLFIPESWNPNVESEYYSPQFNDVRHPSHEISTLSPKLNSQHFLKDPYSTTFNTYHRDHFSQKPTLGLTRSFLPTALLSSTPNIIRNEDRGRVVSKSVPRPSYAPSFKHDTFKTISETYSPSYKPAHHPSLFSSGGSNIIRDKVPSINKLFKPVSTTYNNYEVPSSTPNPRTSYTYSSQGTGGGNGYNSPVSTPLSPTSYSTRTPLLFGTSEPPDYSIEQTLSSVFTSSQMPLEGYTTPTPLDGQSPLVYGEQNTDTPISPRVLFEAPGHTQPSR